jgi:predicted  nucleic acid-binding Zn-ribbon protein
MAEPTLSDVLKAISELQTETRADIAGVSAEVTSLDAKVTSLDAKVTSLDRKVDRLDTAVADGFRRVDRQLADLDRDLTKHMEVDRELERDIEVLKARPARTAARPARRPRTR